MTTKTGCIYMITSPSGKRYVGQTINFAKRMRTYARGEGHGRIGRAITRHGWENMHVQVLHDEVSEADLNKLERHCIKVHNTLSPHGYNLTEGGEDNPMNHPEVRLKHEALMRERQERGENAMFQPEVREKHHAMMTSRDEQNGNPMFRPEVREKHLAIMRAITERCLLYTSPSPRD